MQSRIKTAYGYLIQAPSEVTSYFKNLFKEEEANFPPHLDHLILPSITEDENIKLCCIPTIEEIKSILFSMSDLKAPGPNGFPVIFYKHLWTIVGDDIIKAIISFFQLGSMPKEVNSSLIVLIPKISNPTSSQHFKPISFCNVVYKIISKLLVAKLKPLLEKLFLQPNQLLFPIDGL